MLSAKRTIYALGSAQRLGTNKKRDRDKARALAVGQASLWDVP